MSRQSPVCCDFITTPYHHQVPVHGSAHSSFSVMVNVPDVENSEPENSVALFAMNGAAATFTIPIISLSSSRADTVSGVVQVELREFLANTSE